MPINIYHKSNYEKLEWLCDDIWNLPDQIDSLENWLKTKGYRLPKSSYVADIGFKVRGNASGGGAVITSDSMNIMAQIGMDIYLSEYSNTPG